MAFTDNLQALMGAKGISRRKLAKECGISPGAVNSWFNRSAENISLQTLEKLSDYRDRRKAPGFIYGDIRR